MTSGEESQSCPHRRSSAASPFSWWLVSYQRRHARGFSRPPSTSSLKSLRFQTSLPTEWLAFFSRRRLHNPRIVGLRRGAAASVVIRYWGTPPENSGVEVSGGELLLGTLWFTDCEPDQQAPPGESGYGWTETTGGPRYIWVDIGDGHLIGELSTSQVQSLDAAFGDHITLAITPADRLQAVIWVWWPILLPTAVVAALIILIVKRRRLRSSDE